MERPQKAFIALLSWCAATPLFHIIWQLIFTLRPQESGGPIPISYIDDAKAQKAYDDVVKQASCSGASDTLECLRGVSLADLKKAIATTPGLFDWTSVLVVSAISLCDITPSC